MVCIQCELVSQRQLNDFFRGGLAVRAAEFELSYSPRLEQSVGERTPETKPQPEGYSIGDAYAREPTPSG